jgi:hypothetical protein
MIKKVIFILVILSLVGILGCSITSRTTAPASPASVKTIREAGIGSEWAMKQLEINLESELSIVLKLTEGDKVDGYYYLEKGSNIGFKITGNSLVYESKTQGAKDQSITSDRFSFVASQEQGIAYTLTLSTSNDAGKEKAGTTVFLEIIYPASASVFVPIGTK